MRAFLQPFTWIHPDINPMLPTGENLLTYQTGQIEIEVRDDKRNGRGKLFFKFAMDVIDQDFQLGFDSTPESGREHFLQGEYSGSEIAPMVLLHSEFKNCKPMAFGFVQPTDCSVELTDAIYNLISPRIKQILLDIASSYPAPSFWYADQTASRRRLVEQYETFLEGQFLTLYGKLVAAGPGGGN